MLDRNNLKYKLSQSLVPICFGILCLASIFISGQTASYVITETINRITRNTVLVFSLILPVLCGMGLNFGIVLGAIAAQVGLTLITHWSIDGMAGLGLAFVIATVLACIFGLLVGHLFNRVKGQETITGMILGYAANGLYNIVCIFMLGSIIPMYNPELMLRVDTSGPVDRYVGLRNTIELHPDTKSALDKVWKLPVDRFLLILFALCILYFAVKLLFGRGKKSGVKETITANIGILVTAAVSLILWILMKVSPSFAALFIIVRIPMMTVLSVVIVALMIVLLFKTKLGQDIRTVGNSMSVASASGINVDRTRTVSTMLSMVLAAWGQIIYLQNIGNIQTYNSHEQVGTYAVAALLVGGASMEKATIGQAITGTTLFHILFFITPIAAAKVFGDSMYGEYFRVFLCYGIIAISLALYAVKKNSDEKRRLMEEANRALRNSK